MNTNTKKTNNNNQELIISDTNKSIKSYKQFLTRKEVYRPLFLITFLTVIQQFSGMTIMRSYVVKIFNNLSKIYLSDVDKNKTYKLSLQETLLKMIA